MRFYTGQLSIGSKVSGNSLASPFSLVNVVPTRSLAHTFSYDLCLDAFKTLYLVARLCAIVHGLPNSEMTDGLIARDRRSLRQSEVTETAFYIGRCASAWLSALLSLLTLAASSFRARGSEFRTIDGTTH